MHRKFVHAARPHGINSIIIPNIASVSAILAEFKRVDVWCVSVLPDEDQLVLGTVEGSHAGIALVPDADVLQLGIMSVTRFKHLAHVTPVHADLMDRAIGGIVTKIAIDHREKLH